MNGSSNARRAIIYCRVSSEREAADAKTSLDNQEATCRRACAERGYEVVQVLQQVASRSALDRPELEKAIRAIDGAEADILMATTMDRLSGGSKHAYILLEDIAEAGGRVEFVDQDASEVRFLQSIRAFLAEVELERLSHRVRQGIGEKLQLGGSPDGQ